jgi:hypothetical protein
MSILRICSASGCSTRTLGEFCIGHEVEKRPSLDEAAVLALCGRRTWSYDSSRARPASIRTSATTAGARPSVR